jgi:hypothetical protein
VAMRNRLMELNPKAEHKEQALKVLKVCDANRTNEVDLSYDERNPFIVCTYLAPHPLLFTPVSWSPFSCSSSAPGGLVAPRVVVGRGGYAEQLETNG